jgi:hypothetical protein
MNQRIRIHGSPSLRWAVLLSLALLCGCGGGASGGGASGGGSSGGAPLSSASLLKSSTVLGSQEALVVRFDASADPSSVRLSGTLAGEASGTWSKTATENDTYTITPTAGTWRAGGNRTISVTATGRDGGNATVAGAYSVQLVFDAGASATNVVGYADFTNGGGAGTTSAASLFMPLGGMVVAPDGKFFVADYNNHRVLAFNSLPTTPGASADFVLGQPDFAASTNALAQDTHPYPVSISIAGGKMAVADSGARRIVIYNTIPANGSAVPDVVVGQADFTHDEFGCSATRFSVIGSGVGGIQLTPNGKLIVADLANSRVLIWNTVPTSNGQPADLVLGQSTATACVANDDNQDGVQDGTPSARTLNEPFGVWSDGNRLLVTDYGNNRVLLWNSFPAANFAPADVVLGQSAFDRFDGTPDSGPTDRTLSAPGFGVTVSGEQIAVADSNHHRVLIWNRFPTSNFARADMVIGQSSFTTASGGTTASKLFFPFGAYFHEDKLIVADTVNDRLLVFTSK